MSRVAKNPITIPSGLTLNVSGQEVTFKSNKGTLKHILHREVEMEQTGDVLTFKPRSRSILANALSGTSRAIINNIVIGLTKGFERKLELVGVGYRAQAQGKKLNLTLGFSHPVAYDIPEGITIETPSQTEIVIKGCDKHKVGQAAADIMSYRPVEPYKGKGIRPAGLQIVLKEAKKK